MKVCKWCGVEKDLTEFSILSKMKDGHLNKCKPCANIYSKQHRKDNPEYYLKYELSRYQTPKRRELAKRIQANWCLKYPEREKAHTITSNAIRDGRLIPQVCWVCGNKAEAHHPDYSRPLEVVWLCKTHHEEVHHMVV